MSDRGGGGQSEEKDGFEWTLLRIAHAEGSSPSEVQGTSCMLNSMYMKYNV
jgi:hypothetical protein